MKKFHVHRGTSCKITAPTDKSCGNESKIFKSSTNSPNADQRNYTAAY